MSKNIRAFTIALSLSSLVGCVNQFASMPDSTVTDPIEFITQYQSASEKGLIAPLRFLGGEEQEKNYREFSKAWCSVHYRSHLVLALKQVCDANNGTGRGEWCVDKDTDSPLFKAHVEPRSFCSSGTSLAAKVIAPLKGASTKDPDWLSLASSMGYMTKDEYSKYIADKIERGEKLQKAKNERIKKAKLKKQKRLAYERNLMLTTRGLRICQNAKYKYQGRFTGFVEDFTDKKIKINVVNLGRDGETVSGFQPSTIWDYPSNWYVCE